MEIAHKLKIPINKAKKIYFSGIGGSLMEGIIVGILIRIDENDIKIKAVFTKAKENAGILGERGFFDHFNVKFSHQKQTIEVSPVTERG